MDDIEKRVRAALAEKDFRHAKLKRDNLKMLLEETTRKLRNAEREVEIASKEWHEAEVALQIGDK